MNRSALRAFLVVVWLLAVLLVGITATSQRSASAMATAASRFLGSLSAGQRQRASFSFDSDLGSAVFSR